MKNEIFKPQYTESSQAITISHLENTNLKSSKIAGFHWSNTPFPYPHTHQHWEVLLVVKGNVIHEINDIKHQATKGYACLIRPQDVHSFHFSSSKCEIISFGFSNEIAEKLFALYPIEKENLISKSPLSFLLQDNTLDAICSKSLAAQFYDKDIYEKYTILIINRLLLAYNEQKLNTIEAYPEWLNSFLLLIKNPKYLRIPITKLVQEFTPYSYSRFSVLFKQYTGQTVVSYIQELKIMRAKELLRSTNYTVSEIIVDLNYESLPNFIETFKKFTGLTPTAFRKSPSNF